MSEHEPASRSVAMEAVIRVALENAPKEYRWSRSFTVEKIVEELDGETTDRTVRRALKDAHALGWVSRQRKTRWEPGPKAEQFSVDED